METTTIERTSVRRIEGLSRDTKSELWAIVGDINEMLKEIGVEGVKIEETHNEEAKETILSVQQK